MFKCEFSKPIWKDAKKSELHEVLVKEIQLPFPPYPGLYVSSGSFNSGEIVAVCWNVERELFLVSTREEAPWTDSDFHMHTADEIQKHHVKRLGWDIPSNT